jgi:C_GCAxxG_C_C family probable redox protein
LTNHHQGGYHAGPSDPWDLSINPFTFTGVEMVEKIITVEEAKAMVAEEQKQLVGRIEQTGYENELQFWGCSQAVFGALQQHLDLGDQDVFAAATGFAGGVAKNQEVCGALLGGIMAIGVTYGRRAFEEGKVGHEQRGFLEAQHRSARLCEKFKEEFGTLHCRDIRVLVGRIPLGDENNYYTLEGFENHHKCADVTGKTARLAAEVLFESSDLYDEEITARQESMKRLRALQLEAGARDSKD